MYCLAVALSSQERYNQFIDQIHCFGLGIRNKKANRKKKKFLFLLKFFSLFAAFYETQQAQ
jgi:hypothetical protein